MCASCHGHNTVKGQADAVLRASQKQKNKRQLIIWTAALLLGAVLGWLNNTALNELFNFVATVFTRLFQFISVPTIALAVITTLASLYRSYLCSHHYLYFINYFFVCASSFFFISTDCSRKYSQPSYWCRSRLCTC